MHLSTLSTTTIMALAALANAASLPQGNTAGDIVPGKYIVAFKKSITDKSAQALTSTLESDSSTSIDTIFNIDNQFKGFTAEMPEEEVNKLREHPDVEYIEEDRVMTISAIQEWPKNWGLGRVTWRRPKSYKKFIYPEEAGKDVDVYVLDTGCNIHHEEFEGRAQMGPFFVEQDAEDRNGHGTHVAGIVAGKQSGVAKKANIICVKVMDSRGFGTYSSVIAGLHYVSEQAKKTGRKSVANLSIEGPDTKTVTEAVESAVKSGVTVVAAAGNSNKDACQSSPASSPSAITVASSTNMDNRSSFSNWGKCVKLFAPGSDIYSSWIDGKYRAMSGTSQASPHVAGIAALYLSQGLQTPQEVMARIIKKATKDVIKDSQGSPNVLVYSQGMTEKASSKSKSKSSSKVSGKEVVQATADDEEDSQE